MQTQTTCTPVTIGITPIAPNGNNGPWQLDYMGNSSAQKLTFPIVWFPKDTGCYNITFQLATGTQPNLSFATTNPILVNGSPPTTQGQIQPPGQVTQGQKTLTVMDLNNNNAAGGWLTLNYTLNFTGGDAQHATLDPIIKNGGKTTVKPPLMGGAQALDTATLIISLVILVIVVFIALRVRKIH
jgi:hypothetical protein